MHSQGSTRGCETSIDIAYESRGPHPVNVEGAQVEEKKPRRNVASSPPFHPFTRPLVQSNQATHTADKTTSREMGSVLLVKHHAVCSQKTTPTTLPLTLSSRLRFYPFFRLDLVKNKSINK